MNWKDLHRGIPFAKNPLRPGDDFTKDNSGLEDLGKRIADKVESFTQTHDLNRNAWAVCKVATNNRDHNITLMLSDIGSVPPGTHGGAFEFNERLRKSIFLEALVSRYWFGPAAEAYLEDRRTVLENEIQTMENLLSLI
jgi:hypothetical protein